MTQRDNARNFIGFYGFELFWGVGLPLTLWTTIMPAYINHIGGPLWLTAVIAQSQPDWDVRLEGELCLVRRDRSGCVGYMAAANVGRIRLDDLTIRPAEPNQLLEWRAHGMGARSEKRI